MTKKDTKEEKKEVSKVELRDNNYQFKLQSCYSGTSHYLELIFDLGSTQKSYFIYPRDDPKLEINIDTFEMAEDIDTRMNWVGSWMSGNIIKSMPSKEATDTSHMYRLLDKGIVEVGVYTDTSVEYYLSGDYIKGLIHITKMDTVPSDESNMKTEWYTSYYPRHDAPSPYILSHRGMEVGYMPLERSALPKRIKKRIPFRYRYWNEPTDSKRHDVRCSLVKAIDNGEIHLPLSETNNATYLILKEWVPGVEEKYRFILHQNKNFSFVADIDLTSTLSSYQITKEDKPEFDVNFEKEGTVKLSDEPRFAEAVDWGSCMVYENSDDYMSIKFRGAKLKGIWSFTNNKDNKWDVDILEAPRRSGHDLSNDQIDMIVKLSRAHKDRPEIAEKVGCCYKTVYFYQRALDLL